MGTKGKLELPARLAVALPTLGAPLAIMATSCALPPGGPPVGVGPPSDQFLGILFAAGLVVLGVYAWHKLRSSQGAGSSKRISAEEIARERYARGEISRDEFLLILADLRTQHHERL